MCRRPIDDQRTGSDAQEDRHLAMAKKGPNAPLVNRLPGAPLTVTKASAADVSSRPLINKIDDVSVTSLDPRRVYFSRVGRRLRSRRRAKGGERSRTSETLPWQPSTGAASILF
ncbi:hypothetical protein MRX96_055009 [Rhipicephalus microplus]